MRKEKIINFIETKNEKLKEKKARRTTWVSQDAGLKAAPGRFSQVEDFFHARSSSLVVPHLAKPFPVSGNATQNPSNKQNQTSSTINNLPQSFNCQRISTNFSPISVSEYSTLGGNSLKLSLVKMPSSTISLSC